MAYNYKYFFVKPSSTFPLDDVNDYFITRCNSYQQSTEEFIIGSMFNAREMVQIMYFSDVTRDAHNMEVNHIVITATTDVVIPRNPMEVLNVLLEPTTGFISVLASSNPVKGIIYD